MFDTLARRWNTSKQRTAYQPRHAAQSSPPLQSHEQWRQHLRAQYPLAFAEPTPDVAWVDALFDRWLAER